MAQVSPTACAPSRSCAASTSPPTVCYCLLLSVTVCGAGLAHGLRAFPQLRSLDLSDVDAPRFAVDVLPHLPHLSSLNLFYVNINDHEVSLI